MRPIKFRAWHNTTVNGNFIMSTHEEIVKNCGAYLCDDEKFPNRIIMQFTGLTDKNGVDIYEGDICKGVSNYDGRVTFIPSVIGFYDGTFGIEYPNGRVIPLANAISQNNEWHIIGNIHQSPELMESK